MKNQKWVKLIEQKNIIKMFYLSCNLGMSILSAEVIKNQ
jgi:hypothetical protein